MVCPRGEVRTFHVRSVYEVRIRFSPDSLAFTWGWQTGINPTRIPRLPSLTGVFSSPKSLCNIYISIYIRYKERRERVVGQGLTVIVAYPVAVINQQFHVHVCIRGYTSLNYPG